MRIIFIGYMGAGKTHVAKQLAAQTGKPWRDLDEAVETVLGMPIARAFEEQGEPHFRKIESEVLQNLSLEPLSDWEILSCGGGTPCAPKNTALLKKMGRVVHLDPSFDCIWERLQLTSSQRPLIGELSGLRTADLVRAHWMSRRKCYEMADVRWTDQTYSDSEIVERSYAPLP